MISEITQKKLIIFLLTAGVILGLIFLIFAVFINRGKLIIEAEAPYTLSIDNFKTQNCLQNTCEVTLAPNRYLVTVAKQGYVDVEKAIEIPVAGTAKEKITFQFIPVITEKGLWNTIVLPENAKNFGKNLYEINLNQARTESITFTANFTEIRNLSFSPNASAALIDNGQKVYLLNLAENSKNSSIADLEISPGKPVFFDTSGEYITFIDTDKSNYRQTLYEQKLIPLESRQPLTTFVRTIDKYSLFFSPDRKKIALIDQSSEENSVYIVDLELKTRTKIVSKPLISSLKWLGANSNDFLLQARVPEQFSEEIWLWDNQQKNLKLVPLQTDLKNVLSLPSESPTIIAAVENNTQAGLSQSVNANAKGFSFIEYNLKTGESTLIKNVGNLNYPEKIELSTNPGEILFLTGNKVYSLKYEN